MVNSTSLQADLDADLETMPAACNASIAVTEERVGDILRPAGALARLDGFAVWLAGWQRTSSPAVERPFALIFAGDHGVAADGVSAYPAEVTAAMLEAVRQDRASICAMANVAGAGIRAVDVGVGKPTANMRVEPAMDEGRFEECFEAGRAAVRELETDLLVLGELGIGNTTAAAAVSSALLHTSGSEMVGAGTGVVGDALAMKVVAVDESVARARSEGADAGTPLEVLRQVGGTELVALAGAMFEARLRSVAVLLDGYVTAAPALAIQLLDPRLGHHLRAGHASAEPGHRLVLEAMGLEPLLTMDFRLGEGSGAMAAVPLAKMACALVNDVPTFAEWFGESGDG